VEGIGRVYLCHFCRSQGHETHSEKSKSPHVISYNVSILQHQRTAIHILRRAEAVKTTGIIRPLGITEIGRAASEGVGSHWSPDGTSWSRHV
jgi:hypothetical protein